MTDTGTLTVTIDEAAKRLGIGRNQAYEAARSGQIPVIRIGKRILVPVHALEQLIKGPSVRHNDIEPPARILTVRIGLPEKLHSELMTSAAEHGFINIGQEILWRLQKQRADT